MNKQTSLKSYLSIQKDLHQGKGQKRTQPPLKNEAIKKQKMINHFEKNQLLLTPEKTPLTSPQKQLISPTKVKTPTKFYDIEKIIDTPVKSSIQIKSTQNLYQTQIDAFTCKKNSIIESDNEIEYNINKIKIKNNLWEKEQENKSSDIEQKELENLKNKNVEDFIKDIFNSTEKIKNKHKKEQEIKLLKPQLPQKEIKLKAGISSIDLSKNIIPLLLSERRLKLPEKYEKLQKLFEALDHVLRYDKAMNRQSIIFTNLLKRLENICHCNVTNKQLGQIMKVYPDSYYLRAFRAKDGNINWYIDFNNSASALEQAIEAGKLADIRRKTFRQNLLNYVYKEYDKFLELKGHKKIDYSTLTNWDPEFDLENVPDITPVDLPTPPLFKNQNDIEKKLLESKPKEPKSLIRKSDILNKYRNNNDSMSTDISVSSSIKYESNSFKSNEISSSSSSISSFISKSSITSPSKTNESSSVISHDKAINSNSNSINMNTSISTNNKSSGSSNETIENKSRGEMREKISALRLRLREKDRLRKLKQQQTPEDIRKKALISRLPEIIKTMKKYYVSKKTTSLRYNDVRNMLQLSCSINSLSGVDEHIKLLIEINIECCRKVPTVNYGTFLKFFPDKVDETLKKIEEMKTKIKT